MAADATPEQALYDYIKSMMERARLTDVDMKPQITLAKRQYYELTGAEGPERG